MLRLGRTGLGRPKEEMGEKGEASELRKGGATTGLVGLTTDLTGEEGGVGGKDGS